MAQQMLEQNPNAMSSYVDVDAIIEFAEKPSENKKAKRAPAKLCGLSSKPTELLSEGVKHWQSDLDGSFFTGERYAVPEFGKNTKKAPKRMYGAFKDLKDVVAWLAQTKHSGIIDQARYQQFVDAVTQYYTVIKQQLSGEQLAKFQKKQHLLSGAVTMDTGSAAAAAAIEKPKKTKKSVEKKEKKEKSKSESGSGGFLSFSMDAPPASKEDVSKLSKVKSVQDVIMSDSNAITHLEVVYSPTHGLVLYRALDAPNNSVLKSIAKFCKSSVESLKVSNGGKDSKFRALLARKSARAVLGFAPLKSKKRSVEEAGEKSKAKRKSKLDEIRKEAKKKTSSKNKSTIIEPLKNE